MYLRFVWLSLVALAITINAQASLIKGYLDGVKINSDGSSTVSGWACKYGDSNPIDVHFYINGSYPRGKYIGATKANSTGESAIGNQCTC